ncbi:MAG: membrane protease YdiL (CAAX protease family) [Verrucomicrobiales bacterium]|jgi:membrane protease YdiL (CAAX protease family)
MEAIHERIQTDLWWFAWIAFAVAIPLFAFLRQRDPLIRWHDHGNVSTKPFNWIDLILVVLIFFGIKVIMMTFVSPASEGAEPPKFTSAMILTDMLVKIAMLSFFIYWLMIRRANVIEMFGLKRLSFHGVSVWGCVVGLLAVPLVMGVGHVATNALSKYLGEIPPQPIVTAFTESGDMVFRSITMVGVVVITPIFEELFYRGYLYGVTKRFSDRFFATLFSCLIFTIAHAGVITVLPIFTLAIFLVLAYELSGSLWVPIVIHVLFNLANVAGMLFTSSGG